MPRALQSGALPQVETRQLPAAAALAALGNVYGDIGTSLCACSHGRHRLDRLLGGASGMRTLGPSPWVPLSRKESRVEGPLGRS